MSQKLTFKTAGAILIDSQPVTCPYTGPEPFKNAEYVRTCKKLRYLCSCTYWNKPEVFNICWTKIQADQETGESEQ
jgi:hypothetical protein